MLVNMHNNKQVIHKLDELAEWSLHIRRMRIIMTIIGSHPQSSCKQIKLLQSRPQNVLLLGTFFTDGLMNSLRLVWDV